MIPTQHPSNNDILRAPRDTPNEECSNLAITRACYENGQEIVVSFWLPTAAELALLVTGHAVAVSAWGRTHPPLYIGVAGNGDEILHEAST